MNPAKFVNESYTELKKSTWLTRQQAVGYTGTYREWIERVTPPDLA